MSVTDLIRAEIEKLKTLPCKCIVCGSCNGTGIVELRGPEYFEDHERCEDCDGGISETCERCMEMEELYEQLEERS